MVPQALFTRGSGLFSGGELTHPLLLAYKLRCRCYGCILVSLLQPVTISSPLYSEGKPQFLRRNRSQDGLHVVAMACVKNIKRWCPIRQDLGDLRRFLQGSEDGGLHACFEVSTANEYDVQRPTDRLSPLWGLDVRIQTRVENYVKAPEMKGKHH